MHTISQFVSSLVTIRSRITATVIALSLLSSFAPWGLGRYVKVKAAPNPPLAAASGYLYVLNDCPRCPNQIFGFAVHEATGELTLLPNFPVSTGGNGSSDDRGELLATDRGNLRLFAVNNDTNTVSAFTIDPGTGALTLIRRINLGNGQWISIAVRGSGSDSLLVVADSTSVDSNNLGRVAGFKVTETTVTAGSFKSTRTVGPLTTAFSRHGNVVYVGGGLGSKFASFRISANGTFTNDGVLSASGEDPVAYSTDAGGGRLFLADRVGHTLRAFTMTNDVPTNKCPTFNPTGLGEVGQGVLVANDRFYVVSDRGIASNLVGVYKITGSCSTGSPTFISPSLFQSGARGINLLALNMGRNFLFALNRSALTNESPPESPGVTTFRVNTSSGALTRLTTKPIDTPAGTTLNGMAYWTVPPITTTMTILAPTAIRRSGPGEVARVVILVTATQGTPSSGTISLRVDGGPERTKDFSGAGAAFDLVMPRVGDHPLTATYSGSGLFAPITGMGTLRVKQQVLVTRP